MGGQVLGGGVIVLVAVLLWLVYLLPTWHSRRQYDAAERNAVRLNQALRVLAETSDTPEEVRIELSTRTALAQQKLARRALAEREHAALEEARIDLESARAARAAARYAPEARRARARRRMRLTATMLAIASLGLGAWGGWQFVVTGGVVLLGAATVSLVVCLAVLHRMNRVAARAATRTHTVEGAAERRVADVQDVAIAEETVTWVPRPLPRPLTASAGSRAAAVLDAEAARDALRAAAVEEEMRQRAERQRPPSIDAARTARAAGTAELAGTGRADDAAIEAHVRQLLARRAVGE